jgi:hypothetical protein
LTTLDAHFGAEPVDSFLLKADTQGAEAAILAGARHLLRRHDGDCAFILEFWPFGTTASGWSVAGYLDAIEDLGQEIFVLDETTSRLYPVSVSDLAKAVRHELRPEGRAFRNIALLPHALARDAQVGALIRGS